MAAEMVFTLRWRRRSEAKQQDTYYVGTEGSASWYYVLCRAGRREEAQRSSSERLGDTLTTLLGTMALSNLLVIRKSYIVVQSSISSSSKLALSVLLTYFSPLP